MDASCHTHGCVMSHTWMSHVARRTHGWVMSHTWMSHVTHMDELCHTHGCVMSHTWLCHVTHVIELCHTYKWVMCLKKLQKRAQIIGVSDPANLLHADESCHTKMSPDTHMNKSHVSQIIADMGANFGGVGSCERADHFVSHLHSHCCCPRRVRGMIYLCVHTVTISRSTRHLYVWHDSTGLVAVCSLPLLKAGTRYDISRHAYSDCFHSGWTGYSYVAWRIVSRFRPHCRYWRRVRGMIYLGVIWYRGYSVWYV